MGGYSLPHSHSHLTLGDEPFSAVYLTPPGTNLPTASLSSPIVLIFNLAFLPSLLLSWVLDGDF